MIKKDNKTMPHRVYMILILSCFLVTVNGQDRNNIPGYLVQKFQHFIKMAPREEVYVHTDRQKYISGECIWFKVYLQDKVSSRPSLNSFITYIELLNYDNQPVFRKRISTRGGFGSGSIVLPDSLSSGTYTILAYTGWMKNFLPENCFTSRISIYNAIHTDTYREVRQSEKSKSTGINNGLTLAFRKPETGPAQFVIVSDSNYRASNKEQGYIFIHNRGNILFVDSIRITKDSVWIDLHKYGFMDGMNHITIFNEVIKPVYEGYFYKKPAPNDAFSVSMPDSSGTRDKIALMLKPNSNTLLRGSFSASVSPLTVGSEVEDIANYFLHGSELGQAGETITSISGDSLLALPGNWIKWNEILIDKVPSFKYGFEKETHYLTGKLVDKQIQKGIAGELVLLCIPGKNSGFSYCKTDSNGNFYFPLPSDDDTRDLLIMPDIPSDNKILSVHAGFPDHEKRGSALLTDHIMPQGIVKSGINYQVQKIYGMQTDTLIPADTVVEATRFYGKPDQELVMADYIDLPTMEEVFFELLQHVSYRKKKSGSEIMITDRVDNKPYFSIPALMIDGVIIKDPAMIMEMDPELVEKIDVIRGIHIVGQYVFRGIVNVITKSGDFRNVTLPEYMIRIPYRGVERQTVFAGPDYSNDSAKNSRLPDYRNTLFWSPDITPQKPAEFWTGDRTGDYQILFQGYSEDEGWISSGKIFHVR